MPVGSDGRPSKLPLGASRATRPGDVSRALTGRWGPHGTRLLDMLGDIAEGRYIPRLDTKGQPIPGQEDCSDPTRYPSLELQARVLVLLVERIVGKVPDMVVTADATERPKFDLSKFKTREDLAAFKRLMLEIAPTNAERAAQQALEEGEVVDSDP